MLKYILIFVLFTFPCFAQESYSWGDYFGDLKPSEVYIQSSETHFGDIFFENNLTMYTNEPVNVQLSLNGYSFNVYILQAESIMPDQIIVVPPPGFEAKPSSAMAPDLWTTKIELHQIPLG